jgi:hypothetical protein
MEEESVLITCPQGFTLDYSYTDPDYRSALCRSGELIQPPPPPPPPSEPLPEIIEPAPICPNGEVIGLDNGTHKCMPLECGTDSTLKTDANGTIGCTPPGKPNDPPIICPYGLTNKYEGNGMNFCVPAVMPLEFLVTANNSFCPKGYDMTVYMGFKCEISSNPNAGIDNIGDIIKKCRVPNSGALPYDTPNPDPNILIQPGSQSFSQSGCPNNSNIAVNDQCQMGCAVGSGPVKICGPGTKYVLDANNTLQCEPESSAAFTNINDFKSKKERKVESFSQIKNSKCKARY